MLQIDFNTHSAVITAIIWIQCIRSTSSSCSKSSNHRNRKIQTTECHHKFRRDEINRYESARSTHHCPFRAFERCKCCYTNYKLISVVIFSHGTSDSSSNGNGKGKKWTNSFGAIGGKIPQQQISEFPMFPFANTNNYSQTTTTAAKTSTTDDIDTKRYRIVFRINSIEITWRSMKCCDFVSFAKIGICRRRCRRRCNVIGS